GPAAMGPVPATVDLELRDRQRQRAPLLHLTVGGPGLFGTDPGKRPRRALRRHLEWRAVSAVPDHVREREPARSVPRVRAPVEHLTMPSDPCGFKTSLPGWPLALFRIAYGVLFLDMAFQKAPWINYGWLEGFIQKEIANPAFGWYAAFLQHVVVPHLSLFGLPSFGFELALCVSLLFGILTHFAGIAGFLCEVNIVHGAL